MCLARTIRLSCKRSKFLTCEFLVHFRDLQWEPILQACVAITNKARDLRIRFQRRPNRFDFVLCCIMRNVAHDRADLLAERLKENLLIVQLAASAMPPGIGPAKSSASAAGLRNALPPNQEFPPVDIAHVPSFRRLTADPECLLSEDVDWKRLAPDYTLGAQNTTQTVLQIR